MEENKNIIIRVNFKYSNSDVINSYEGITVTLYNDGKPIKKFSYNSGDFSHDWYYTIRHYLMYYSDYNLLESSSVDEFIENYKIKYKEIYMKVKNNKVILTKKRSTNSATFFVSDDIYNSSVCDDIKNFRLFFENNRILN